VCADASRTGPEVTNPSILIFGADEDVPFQLKTGLGLSGGPKLKPDKEENEPDQTVKNASPNPAGFPVINEGPRRAVG
jgi:hypothetical protein